MKYYDLSSELNTIGGVNKWIPFVIIIIIAIGLFSAIAIPNFIAYRKRAADIHVIDSKEKTADSGIIGKNCMAKQDKKIINSLDMEFVYIEPGTFMMGSTSSEPWRWGDDWEKQHRVTLTRGFYMQTTEVTQGQWRAVMGNNPSYFKNCGDNCPVEQVSWNDVQAFIQKLNMKEGTNSYKLPTDAEWEYAARAGSTTAFANGGISEPICGYDSNLDAMGWYCGNSNNRTHPVAQKQPNTWGLYDMHGNVWEMCQDWFGDYPSGSAVDPGSGMVIRGGSWNDGDRNCRSAVRVYLKQVGSGLLLQGFRLALFPGQGKLKLSPNEKGHPNSAIMTVFATCFWVGIATGYIAKKKEKSFWKWGSLGFFIFGPGLYVGLIIAVAFIAGISG